MDKETLTPINDQFEMMTQELESSEGLNLTGEHVTFEIDHDSFGYKYFDMEEENSKEHLSTFKGIGRWFSQMAIQERPKVIKQWREMAVEADFEWINDNFFTKLYDDEWGDK